VTDVFKPAMQRRVEYRRNWLRRLLNARRKFTAPKPIR